MVGRGSNEVVGCCRFFKGMGKGEKKINNKAYREKLSQC